MQFGAVTDIGMHRKINEDNYYVNESDTFPYAVVADGPSCKELIWLLMLFSWF